MKLKNLKEISVKKWSPKQGIECMFIRTSKTRGVKIFCNKREIEFSYNKQKLAAKHGIGPKVYSGIKMCSTCNLREYDDSFSGSGSWGEVITRSYGYYYITEFAKVRKLNKKEQKQIKPLEEKMEKLDLGSYDLHDKNMGMIRGRLVCIDFGKESVS